MCQKVYTDLMRLTDLLPSKTDLERKIEISTFLSRTRHLFIRLEALVKWSSGASKVDKCEKISNFLDEQSLFLVNTANSLSRLLKETLVGARLPPFTVLLAIDIFTNKGYTRLPKSIKAIALPPDPATEREMKQALLDLNRIIQNRLCVTQIPRQFKIMKIANGRVQFTVPNEFRVTLTLMSEAQDFPWRILDIEFLVRDLQSGYQNLVNPVQAQFILKQAQSRLLYRNFDKRQPLVHLYDMLHSFSLSLQLDILHEQAQKSRSKRPLDQLTVEVYRPAQSLCVSYWRGLSRCQFQPIMTADGKLQHTAYMITIHVDPNDLQRPLVVTHHPDLLASENHRVGNILQGHCLSFDKLLARTITVRAEQILEELRQELMVISPGPIRLADAPLCIYVPLLWPCHAQEYLHVRVDPVHGTVCASCPALTSSAHSKEVLLTAQSSTSTAPSQLFDGGVCSRVSVVAALHSIELAINRPSTRRVISLPGTSSLAATGEDQLLTASNASLLAAQTKSLRNLSAGETRWRASLCQALTHLRVCLGLVRLAQTASRYKPFWHPVKRTLPLILTPSQARLASSGGAIATSLSGLLVRIQQSPQWPILFAQPIPNNEYYVACEVYPANGLGSSSLSITYRYTLIVCTVLPSNYLGVVIDSNGWLVSNSEVPGSMAATLSSFRAQTGNTGLYLQATHYVPLDGTTVWSHNPAASVSVLRSCMQKLQANLVDRRQARLAQLLARRQRSRAAGGPEAEQLLDYCQTMVPTLTRLVGGLGENLMATCLALELSRAGIVHTGVQFDAAGSLSTVRLISLPNKPLSWQSVSAPALSAYVHQIVLRPHFDPFTNRRNWQLDLAFTGFPVCSSESAALTSSSRLLRHQTTEWSAYRMEDLASVVKNLLAEWDSLCAMHALCYPVVNSPELHLPHSVRLVSYNLRTLSLQYASSYIAEIGCSSGNGFALTLGFKPILSSTGNASVNPTVGIVKQDVIDFDCNPHVIILAHLEDVLNVTNSIPTFCRVLMHTLDFTRAIEPLRDSTISTNCLRSSAFSTTLHPVRNLVLISLSAYDLLAIYRSSLALRISLVTPGDSVGAAGSTSEDKGSQYQMADTACLSYPVPQTGTRVRLTDGHPQFQPTRDGDSFHKPALLSGLTVLPGFQTVFLESLTRTGQKDEERISTTSGLTVHQLAQLTQPPPRVLSGACRPAQSPLMSYLSSSLLFHAALDAVHSLDVPVYPVSSAPPTGAYSTTEQVREEVLQAGSFLSHWPTSNLTAKVNLLPAQRQARSGLSSPVSWRLSLCLSTFSVPTPSAVGDRWAPEALALLEELFHIRVCAAPFQPSAVTGFFRLLMVPPRALLNLLPILSFDLSPTTTPLPGWVELRLGLVATTGIRLHRTTSEPLRVSINCDLLQGQPGVVVRPPCITLQLLVQVGQGQQQQYSKFPPPLAQVVPIYYDWETNRIALALPPGSSPSSGPTGVPMGCHQLVQLLRDADVEARANRLEAGSSNGGGYVPVGAAAGSALWHLAVLVAQALASGCGGGGGPPVVGGDSGQARQQQTGLPTGHRVVISPPGVVMPGGVGGAAIGPPSTDHPS